MAYTAGTTPPRTLKGPLKAKINLVFFECTALCVRM